MSITRILIVDDQPNFLIDALPLYGYEIDSACNGISALRLLNDKGNCYYHLIILDMKMPIMNGWQFIEVFRDRCKNFHVPIIMLTGSEDVEKDVDNLKYAADEYLIKPIRLTKLLSCIETILRRYDIKNEIIAKQ